MDLPSEYSSRTTLVFSLEGFRRLNTFKARSDKTPPKATIEPQRKLRRVRRDASAQGCCAGCPPGRSRTAHRADHHHRGPSTAAPGAARIETPPASHWQRSQTKLGREGALDGHFLKSFCMANRRRKCKCRLAARALNTRADRGRRDREPPLF
jgi:hypothetical protein